MDKKGKVSPLAVIAFCAVLLTVGLVLKAWNPNLFATEAGAPTGTQVVNNGGTGTIVTTNPTISFAATDAQTPGTTVGFTTQMKVGGGNWQTATSGTTTAVPGQSIEFLLTNNTQYHNAYISAVSVTPGSFPKAVNMNKNASVSESIYSTTGVVMSNGIGTSNQSQKGNGVSYNLKDEMTGTAQASTQDMVCIIELTSGVNASTSPQGVTYGSYALVGTATPAWYSPVGVNSRVWIFEQPAITTGSTVTNNIQINTLSTGKLCDLSRMVKTCYTKENFIDSNKGYVYDVADSANTVKSMNQYTYTVYFTA